MDYEKALLDENALLGDLVRDADQEVAIPTCPGWSLRQLLRHVGRGDRWAAQMITDRVDSYLDPRAVRGGKPPEGDEEAAAWLRESPIVLADAVRTAGADTPVWTFTGPRPAAWWLRRRLHEATVHRADAALALGRTFRLAPDLASDGLSEWLDLVAARPGGDDQPLADGATLHLHATDEGLGEAGEWLVTGHEGGVRWEHGHAKADTAVRGPVTDLLLVILRRQAVGAGAVEVFGDRELLTTWLDRTGF